MRLKVKNINNGIANFFISKLRSTNISKRLIYSYLIISTIPVIIVLILINIRTINLIMDNTILTDKITSKLVTESISNYISRFDSITHEIIWDSKLLQDMKDYNNLNIKQKQNFNNELSKILRSRTTYISDIADFTILNEDFNIVYNEGFSYINHSTKLEKIKQGISKSKIINWTSMKQGNSNYIVMTKPIKIQESTYGYLFLALKEKVILEKFEDYNENFNGFGIILDENNNIVSTNNYKIRDIEKKNQLTYEYNQNNIIKSLENNTKYLKKIDKNIDLLEVNNEKYIVMSRSISYTSWKLYGAIPYKYIQLSCIDIYKSYIVTSLFVIIICIFISMYIYKSITLPLNEILTAMNSLNEETVGNKIEISGNDEISFIMKIYNKMSSNIERLIETVRLREKEKRDVTLRMLQAQINPHFLFNTLGSLRYIAIFNNDNTVANGIEALSRLLRNSIVNEDDFVTIEEELENVKNYITIQKIRYGDTFNIEYDINKGLINNKMLKFILQPIVENSIIHGFEDMSDESYIKIELYEDNEFIVFEIIDNGEGISEEKLIKGSFNIDKFAGIGVKNVKERLKLYYNDKFIFEITSREGKGTTTTIAIPKC